MDESSRVAAVEVLTALASSSDYRDRADAGVALARFLDIAVARSMVISLVLDRADTFVTRATAAALARRDDQAGWEVLAAALPDADENSADWIATGIDDAVGLIAAERDRALAICRSLLNGDVGQAQLGAAQLIDLLTDLEPPFDPVGKSNDLARPPALNIVITS